jgi:hypothetical protein
MGDSFVRIAGNPENRYYFRSNNSNSAAQQVLRENFLDLLNSNDIRAQLGIWLPGINSRNLTFHTDEDGTQFASSGDGTFRVDQDGVPISVEYVDPDGNRIFVAFNESGEQGSLAAFNALGDLDAFGAYAADNSFTAFDVGEVGSQLGSTFGRMFATELGGNQFLAAGAGTIAGAIGQQLARAFQRGAFNEVTYDTIVDSSVRGVQIFQPGFAGDLAAQAVGQIASLLVGELLEDLDLDGWGGELFQSLGGRVAAQLGQNLANFVLSGEPAPCSLASPTARYSRRWRGWSSATWRARPPPPSSRRNTKKARSGRRSVRRSAAS